MIQTWSDYLQVLQWPATCTTQPTCKIRYKKKNFINSLNVLWNNTRFNRQFQQCFCTHSLHNSRNTVNNTTAKLTHIIPVLLLAYVRALKERLISNALRWQICSLPAVWPSAASQHMTSNRRGLRSASDVTSPGRLAVADRGWRAINKSVSAVSAKFCRTHFYVVREVDIR